MLLGRRVPVHQIPGMHLARRGCPQRQEVTIPIEEPAVIARAGGHYTRPSKAAVQKPEGQ
jgi:hypothetical protein